ncbi:MAG: hypothetical protein ACI9SK_002136 [Zhongshania sp.]|jgi:hypothetical protein
MPYINDRLRTEEDAGERWQYTQTLSRQSRFVFEPAQVMALLRKQIIGQDSALIRSSDSLIERYVRNLILNLLIASTPSCCLNTCSVRIYRMC